MTVTDGLIIAFAVAVPGWCVWHCIRGIRAMRRGDTSMACCPPASNAGLDADAELARLRAELADLKHPPADVPGPVTPAR